MTPLAARRSTRRSAGKVLADSTKAEMERGALLQVDIAVAELVAKYRPYAQTYYTKGGVATSQAAIIKLATNVVLAKFTHLEARKIGPLALRVCREELVTQGLARNEVNRRIRLIRKMFKWAVAMEMIAPRVLTPPLDDIAFEQWP
jgi:hypothetical protein